MKILNLKVVGARSYNCELFVNGKEAAYKKDSFENRLYRIETQESSVNIQFVSASVYGGKRWSLYSVFIFLVSIFGLFAPKRKETGRGFVFDAVYNLCDGESFCEIKLNKEFLCGGEAFTVTGSPEIVKNYFYVDEDIKKRVKKMKAVKWIIAVGVIVACAVFFLIWGVKK